MREIHDLSHLCLRHFISEDPANADALLMDMQHDSCCLIGVHLEKRLQHVNHEFHWRVIVVEQKHLIQARLLRFWPRTRGKAYARGAASFVIIILRHISLHLSKIGHGRASLQAPFTIN